MKRFLTYALKELVFCAAFIALMLFCDYWLMALHGSALLYSKHLPSVLCLKYPLFSEFAALSIYYLLNRSKIFLWLMVLIHFLPLALLGIVYFTTGTFFTAEILYLVYDTTMDEILGFVKEFISVKSAVVILAGIAMIATFILGGIKILTRYKRFASDERWSYSLVLFACFLLLPMLYFGRWFPAHGYQGVINLAVYEHPLAKIVKTYTGFTASMGSFLTEIRHTTPPADVHLKANAGNQPVVGVLVIGESAIRSHHSVYGYDRKTTPALESHAADMAFFNDALCVMPVTILALKYWLTDLDLEDRHLHWTIFDVCKKAGYKVKIITNQNKSGWADSPLQMIFSRADSIKYMHEENFSQMNDDDGAKSPLDEVLLPHYAAALDSAVEEAKFPTLIVLHLYGSHEPFGWRYPKNFSRTFLDDTSRSARVNEYDTSVLYTDSILAQVIDRLSKLSVPSYMLYFSDHGHVCDYNDDKRTPFTEHNSAYEVPFMVYGNKAYQQEYSSTFKRIKQAVHVPFQGDRAHWGMLEIMLLETSQTKEEDNFLSEHFVVKPRTKNDGMLPYVRESK